MITCKYCEKEIEWIRTENGKLMPYEVGAEITNPEPGQTLVRSDNKIVRFNLGMQLNESYSYYPVHFGRCPNYKPPSKAKREIKAEAEKQKKEVFR